VRLPASTIAPTFAPVSPHTMMQPLRLPPHTAFKLLERLERAARGGDKEALLLFILKT